MPRPSRGNHDLPGWRSMGMAGLDRKLPLREAGLRGRYGDLPHEDSGSGFQRSSPGLRQISESAGRAGHGSGVDRPSSIGSRAASLEKHARSRRPHDSHLKRGRPAQGDQRRVPSQPGTVTAVVRDPGLASTDDRFASPRSSCRVLPAEPSIVSPGLRTGCARDGHNPRRLPGS